MSLDSLDERSGQELLLSGTFAPEVIAAALRSQFPHLTIELRCRFRLAPSFVVGLHSSAKETTIRYMQNAVEYPAACNLPAFVDTTGDGTELQPIGSVRINKLRYKTFGSLNEEDAVRDGFTSVSELKTVLLNFYGEIDDTEVVSIYDINLESTLDAHL